MTGFPRASGILLHPTSLPGPHGIGDFGPDAFRFVEWLERAGQRLWQVMPLNPTGFGDSPYASPSAFAGNPLMISLPWLVGDGLLAEHDIADAPWFPEDHVDFEAVTAFKQAKLRLAFDNFRRGAATQLRLPFEQFSQQEAGWLDDYALFMAIKAAHDGAAWHSWDEAIRLRREDALLAWSDRLSPEIRFHKFVQFQFFRQWRELRRHANERGIRIVGDIPIFVAGDSADVWTNRRMFKLDEQGQSIDVAGVPPDPFSATGQKWGNPVYNWVEMRKDGYQWWRNRVASLLASVDIVRIDHFRGFGAAWLVPNDAETAETGHWEIAPGGEVFAAIRRELGDVPIIIEDLGVITPDVVALREILGFPGMNVLQFAFDGTSSNVYLPHNHRQHSVVYTATHDNQTTVGWFQTLADESREHVQRYLGTSGADIAWDLIRAALASVADTAIIAMQDVLRLDDAARMNVPGKPMGNWAWRYQRWQLDEGLAQGLRTLAATYGRLGRDASSIPNPWDYTNPDTTVSADDPFAAS